MKDIEKVSIEIQQAREKYGYFNSTHEVYGVLIEEVSELFELIKQKGFDSSNEFMSIGAEIVKDDKIKHMIHELTQIAAISLRAIDELKNGEIKWV